MRIVHATPIGDDHAIKTPFLPQDLIQQVVVVAAMFAPEFVVGTHNGPGAPFLYRRLKSRQINLPQRALVHLNINGAPFGFLIVYGIVLDTGGDAAALNALYIRSEERRVGKQSRSRRSTDQSTKSGVPAVDRW